MLYKLTYYRVLFRSIRTSLMFVMIFLSTLLLSQGHAYFTGKVIDYSTGESLVGASIFDLKNPQQGITSDAEGKFSLQLPEGNHTIIISFIGMLSDTIPITISSGKTVKKTIRMMLASSELQGVEVKAGRFDRRVEELTVSMEVIRPGLIENKNTTSIETILDYTPGLNILDGEPQIRGGSGFTFGVGSKVGVFVDGLPVLSGDANRPYWEFIPIENIKQIEVIKGASSVLSGASALSGAIYIHSAPTGLKPVTKAKLYGGFYSKPKYEHMKWWKQFPYIGGMSFLHSRTIKQTDIILGGNIKLDHGFEGPPVTLPHVIDTITDFSESQMAERRAGFNFSLRHRNKYYEGLNYGVGGNFMYDKTKLMIAWLDDSAGFYRA